MDKNSIYLSLIVFFFFSISTNLYSQTNKKEILEVLPSSSEQNEYIFQHKEEWDHLFAKLSEAYKKNKSKAIIARPNIVLCSTPKNKMLLDVKTKTIYQDNDSPNSNRKRLHEKVSFQILVSRSSNDALMHTISSTFKESLNVTVPTSWDGIKVIETPFDFSFNYDSIVSLSACYFNAEIFIHSNGKSIPVSELESIYSFITTLFLGYEEEENVKKVDFIFTKSDVIADEWNHNGTTIKTIFEYNKQYSHIREKYWVLAVSDKGSLFIDKAIFHFSQRHDSTDPTKIYYISDANKDLKYSSIPNIPDSIFLRLPEGEKTAELTFYFISEDGKQYSSQSITLTVPEAEKESTSTK